MYKKPKPLRYPEHADLRLLPLHDYGFARGELVAPIVIDEIGEVAREYPIVFPSDSRLPAALLGVEKDSNAYVALDGRWLAHYVPAHIAQYPLVMARVSMPAGGDRPDPRSQAVDTAAGPTTRVMVLVDEASSALSRSQGEAFFNPDGTVCAALQTKIRGMDRLRTRARVTQRLVKAIEEAGLLVERAVRISRAGEPDRKVDGFRVIDEAALNRLADGAFNSLRQSGALPLVYAALLSWANFRQGPIGQSHPLPAAPDSWDAAVIRFN